MIVGAAAVSSSVLWGRVRIRVGVTQRTVLLHTVYIYSSTCSMLLDHLLDTAYIQIAYATHHTQTTHVAVRQVCSGWQPILKVSATGSASPACRYRHDLHATTVGDVG